jgi:hypothetical protein
MVLSFSENKKAVWKRSALGLKTNFGCGIRLNKKSG